jgi:hypothetical protein
MWDERGVSCSMHVRDEKCMQFSHGTSERQRLLRRPLSRWKIVLKPDVTFINATLPAIAAKLKWHKVLVEVLSYLYIVFGVYQ